MQQRVPCKLKGGPRRHPTMQRVGRRYCGSRRRQQHAAGVSSHRHLADRPWLVLRMTGTYLRIDKVDKRHGPLLSCHAGARCGGLDRARCPGVCHVGAQGFQRRPRPARRRSCPRRHNRLLRAGAVCKAECRTTCTHDRDVPWPPWPAPCLCVVPTRNITAGTSPVWCADADAEAGPHLRWHPKGAVWPGPAAHPRAGPPASAAAHGAASPAQVWRLAWALHSLLSRLSVAPHCLQPCLHAGYYRIVCCLTMQDSSMASASQCYSGMCKCAALTQGGC